MSDYKEVTDPVTFGARLDAAIIRCADMLRERRAGIKGEGDVPQLQGILVQLVDIRNQVISQQLPPIGIRQSRSLMWIFGDSWDPWNPIGYPMMEAMRYHLHTLEIPASCIREVTTPEMRAALELAEEARRLEEEEKRRHLNRAPEVHADVLTMPHAPDKRSLDIAREAAHEEVRITMEPIEAARRAGDHRFLWDLSQQWLIVGLTDYWYRQPLREVAAALHRGVSLAGEAIAAGYPLHAWDVSALFLAAEALRVDAVIQQLLALQPAAWNNGRIKPAHWLVLRIRCFFALQQGRFGELDLLLDEMHFAVFINKLPAELDGDLPEIRGTYWLLRSVQMCDDGAFEASLRERLAFRAFSFRRSGSIAPSALCDLDALGLCRFARRRGIGIQVKHVYLPLGLLDQPSR